MHPAEQSHLKARRQFMTSAAFGAGALAFSSLLKEDGVLAAEQQADPQHGTNPLAPKPPHFPAKAKRCIFIFLAGAPSQLDMFDPKPKLNELHGKPLPKEMTEKVRFAFIKKETAVLMGSPRKFTKHGECGMVFSDFLPNLATCADDLAMIRSMHTDQFNHHPAQLLMNSGVGRFGRPSIGAWLNYGLGTESQSLPGYVVLTSGRGSSGGTSNWTSGFLPSTYQGVLFRNQGEPVLNLANPLGVTREMQKVSLKGISQLNQQRLLDSGDPEIASRINSYELAFRMQMAAPELLDLKSETKQTLDMYGIGRGEPKHIKGGRGSAGGAHNSFSKNCLLARRLVEKGVRYINIYHASWDMHSNLDNELAYNCSTVDQPVAALLKDLKQRGLLEDTMVVLAGEFGRTPLAENRNGGRYKNTGRDHHPYAFTLLMAGGGIRGGQIIGETDELGWSPIKDPVHVNDFHATLLHCFGLNHLKLSKRFGGLDLRLTNLGGKVVKKLLA